MPAKLAIQARAMRRLIWTAGLLSETVDWTPRLSHGTARPERATFDPTVLCRSSIASCDFSALSRFTAVPSPLTTATRSSATWPEISACNASSRAWPYDPSETVPVSSRAATRLRMAASIRSWLR